jgi:AcrR family transcriptional regulator
MPKVVPEYKEIARNKIISAAYSIFYKKGYHKSTMDDIAQEVGVSKASLYSYYKSKEKILQAVTKDVLTGSFKKIFKDNDLKPLESLYNDMISSEDILHLNFEMTASSSHNESISKTSRDIYEKKMDILTNFVEKQQMQGNIRKDINASTLAQLLNAIYTDLAVQIIIGIERTRIHENWNNSMSAVLERNTHDDQKTLNKYFSDF